MLPSSSKKPAGVPSEYISHTSTRSRPNRSSHWSYVQASRLNQYQLPPAAVYRKRPSSGVGLTAWRSSTDSGGAADGRSSEGSFDSRLHVVTSTSIVAASHDRGSQ